MQLITTNTKSYQHTNLESNRNNLILRLTMKLNERDREKRVQRYL